MDSCVSRPPRIATLAANNGVDPIYGLAQGRRITVGVRRADAASSTGATACCSEGRSRRASKAWIPSTPAVSDPDYVRTLFVDDDGSVLVGQHGVCRVTLRGCEPDPAFPGALQHEDVRAVSRSQRRSLDR